MSPDNQLKLRTAGCWTDRRPLSRRPSPTGWKPLSIAYVFVANRALEVLTH
jgi:hypothetical protein